VSEDQLQLDDAVQEFVKNQHDSPGVLTGYVLISAEEGFHPDDGAPATNYTFALMGGDLPAHVILGLLDYAQAAFRGGVRPVSDE